MAIGPQAIFAVVVAIAVLCVKSALFILWVRRWRVARRAALGAQGCSSSRRWSRPESVAGCVLARLPAAHLHECPTYDVEQGQAYESIELQCARGERPPAYDAEVKPPDYGDVPS